MKNINFPGFLLFLFLIKTVFFVISFPDAIIACALVCLYGYYLYQRNNTPLPINENTLRDVDILKGELSDIKTLVSSLRLSTLKR